MRQLLRSRPMPMAMFLGTTVLSALVYWIMWLAKPDYFVVQAEVNLYPIATVDSLLWNDASGAPITQPPGLGDLTKDANKLIAEANVLGGRHEILRATIADLERRSKALSSVMETNRAKSIDEYRSEELKPLDTERVKRATEITEIEKHLPADERVYHPLRSVVAEMRLELARLDLRVAQREYEISNRIVSDSALFPF